MPSEFSISFVGAGGHTHNGAEGGGSLISTPSYSIFDWNTSTIGDQARIERQVRNKQNLENWIIELVNSRPISPRILRLLPATVNGKVIVDGTLDANKIIAGTITGPLLANGTVSGVNIVAGTITGPLLANGAVTGVKIAAEAITADKIQVGTITGTQLATNSVGSDEVDDVMSIINLQSDFVATNATFYSTDYDGTTPGTGTAGWRLWANGDAEFNDVYVRGTITASTISGSTLTTDDGTNGIEITSDGYIRGTGGNGVRIKNSDGTTGETKLFKNDIYTLTSYASLFTAGSGNTSFEADGNGVRVSTTNDRPLDLQRNFVTDAHFIRFYKTSGTPGESGKIRFNAANGLVVAYDTTSDERLKTNIKKLSNGIEIIKKITPVEYNFIEDSEGVSHGFIAQDLYKVYDKPVYKGGENPREDPWSIDYSKMVPILTTALQEAIDKIESLEKRLQAIEEV